MERTLSFFNSGLMALEHRLSKHTRGQLHRKEEVDLNRK